MRTGLKTWLKRGAKLLGIVLGGLLLLVVLVLLLLQTGWGKKLLKERVLAAVNDSLVGSVQVERLDGNLLGGLELQGVTLRDSRGHVVAHIPRARADYALFNLIHSELSLREVQVDAPLIIARTYPDGVMNLSLLSESDDTPGEPSDFKVSLARAALKDGTLVYLNQQVADADNPPAPDPALDAWLKAVDDTHDVPKLQQDLRAYLAQREPAADVRLAAVDRLALDASFHMYGSERMSAALPSLRADVLGDPLGGRTALTIETLRFFKSVAHLEADIQKIGVGGASALEGIEVAVAFDTEPDELGNPVITAPRKFIAALNRLQLDDKLVRRVAPDAPLTAPLSASLTAGGSLDQIFLHARAGCQTPHGLSLGGDVSFPNESEHEMGEIRYNLALRIEDFDLTRCIDLGMQPAQLTGAVTVQGRGSDPQRLQADLRATLRDTAFGEYKLDRLYLAAHADKGVFDLNALRALTPYGQLDADAHFELEGNYQLRLDVGANARVRQLAERLGTSALQTGLANIHLESQGTLNLGADAPLEKVTRADLLARWRIEDARVEQIRLQHSRGEVSLKLQPAAPGTRAQAGAAARKLDFGADVLVQALRAPQVHAQFLALEANGSGTLALPLDDPLAALKTLASTWHVRARDVSATPLRVQDADVHLNVSRTAGRTPLDWTLDGTIQDASFEQNHVDTLDLALKGNATIQQRRSGTALGPIAATGRVDVDGLTAGGTAAKSAHITLDVHGTPPALAGEVELRAKDVRAGGERLPQVDLRATMDGARAFDVRAKVQRMLTPQNIGSVTMTDATRRDEDGKPRTQELTLDARGTLSADFLRLEFEKLELSSPELTLSTSERAVIDLHGSQVNIQGLTLQTDLEAPDASATCALDSDAAPTSTSIALNGRFATHGTEDMHLTLQNIDLGVLREKLELHNLMPPIKARISGAIDLEGTARDPLLRVDVRVCDLLYQHYGPITARLKGGYAARKLSLETLTVQAYNSTLLDAHGSVPLDLNLAGKINIPFDQPIDLSVELPALSMENLREPVPFLETNKVRGSLQGNLTLAGTVLAPTIALKVDATDFAFSGEVGGQQVNIDQVSTNLTARYRPPANRAGGIDANYTFSWQGKELLAANFATPIPLAQWVHAMLDTTQPLPDFERELADLPLRLRIKTIDLDVAKVPISAVADVDAAGTVSIDIQAGGTFNHPNASARLNIRDLGWDGVRGLYLSSELTLTDQLLNLAHLDLAWDKTPKDARSSATAQDAQATSNERATRGVKRAKDASATKDASPNQRLRAPGRAEDSGEDAATAAPARRAQPRLLRNVGRAPKPQSAQDAPPADGGQTNQHFFKVLSARGKFPMPIDMLFGESSLSDLPIEFQVQLYPLQIKQLDSFDYEFSNWAGTLAAFLKVDGTLSQPRFNGRAGAFNLNLNGNQPGTVALEFSGQNNRLQATGSICRVADTVLDLRADLPITTDILALAAGKSVLADGPIEATIKAQQVELAGIYPANLGDAMIKDISGSLDLDLALSGTWRQPIAEGKLLLENGALTLSAYGRRFTNITLDLDVNQQAVALKKLRIGEDDSFVTASGVLTLEQLLPAHLKAQLETKNLSIAGFVPNLAASITSKADIRGDFTTPTQTVRVQISGLNVTMPKTAGGDLYPTELDGEIIVLDRHGKGSHQMDIDALVGGQDGGAGRAQRLEVRVLVDRGSWLHHPVADVEFHADLTATLGGPQPVVVGSVSTVRGLAELLGKEFEVPEQENAIRFTGDAPPDPVLDIRALHMLDRELVSEIGEPSEGEPRIIIRVRGRATEPRLIMESDPLMSETEILYVLMTGRAPSQAEAGEESRVSSMALGAASGIFAGMLQERLSGTLPLDVVRLQPGEEGFRDLRLQVGKYVTDDIFVSYVLRLGADETEGMNAIKIDYRFLPTWKLGFQLSNQLNGDLNVFWDIY